MEKPVMKKSSNSDPSSLLRYLSEEGLGEVTQVTKSLIIIFFILCTAMISGCKKDTPKGSGNTPALECKDYVFEEETIIGPFYNTSGIQYTKPFFNPNNADEFVYIKAEQNSRILVKHVVSTGQETVLCNSHIITSQPQWGKQGWIIFSVLGNTIWKIHEDGTGLAQISPSGEENYSPKFNANGDVFICSGSIISNRIIIRNLLFDTVDSLKFNYDNFFLGNPCGNPIDFKNAYYRYSNHNSPTFENGFCKITNNESLEVLNIIDTPIEGGQLHATCKNDQHIYYVQFWNGLYRLDINTKQTEKIMDNCRSRYINTLSMSPDGNFLLYERVRGEQTTPGGTNIDEQSEIFMYNVMTGTETRILWEE